MMVRNGAINPVFTSPHGARLAILPTECYVMFALLTSVLARDIADVEEPTNALAVV